MFKWAQIQWRHLEGVQLFAWWKMIWGSTEVWNHPHACPAQRQDSNLNWEFKCSGRGSKSSSYLRVAWNSPHSWDSCDQRRDYCPKEHNSRPSVERPVFCFVQLAFNLRWIIFFDPGTRITCLDLIQINHSDPLKVNRSTESDKSL